MSKMPWRVSVVSCVTTNFKENLMNLYMLKDKQPVHTYNSPRDLFYCSSRFVENIYGGEVCIMVCQYISS